jgi:hypothetical protein
MPDREEVSSMMKKATRSYLSTTLAVLDIPNNSGRQACPSEDVDENLTIGKAANSRYRVLSMRSIIHRTTIQRAH